MIAVPVEKDLFYRSNRKKASRHRPDGFFRRSIQQPTFFLHLQRPHRSPLSRNARGKSHPPSLTNPVASLPVLPHTFPPSLGAVMKTDPTYLWENGQSPSPRASTCGGSILVMIVFRCFCSRSSFDPLSLHRASKNGTVAAMPATLNLGSWCVVDRRVCEREVCHSIMAMDSEVGSCGLCSNC